MKRILQALSEDTDPTPVVEQLILYLPGPLTPQMMLSVDTTQVVWDEVAEQCYGQLLEQVTRCFKPEWAKHGLIDRLRKVFVIDSGTDVMLSESLLALCQGVKACPGPCRKLDFILDTLKCVLSSEFVTSAAVFACKRHSESDFLAESYLQRWEDCVQVLVSLPNRIANKLKGKVDRFFTLECYSKVMFVLVAKALAYVSFISEHMTLNLKPIAIFLSKVISSYKLNSAPKQFFKLLNSWCSERGEVFIKTINKVVNMMETSCIETTSLMIFKNCSEESVKLLLKAELLKISGWKYTLTMKIPLLTFYTDQKIITNLVALLGSVTNEEATNSGNVIEKGHVLPSLILQVMSVWGDKTAMLHTPQEQHLYLSKLIVLGFNYLCTSSQLPLHDMLKSSLHTKLSQGMPSHLENTTEGVRVMGMITAECVISHLNKLVKDKDKRAELQFDFTQVKKESAEIVNDVRRMSEFKFNADQEKTAKGDDLLEKLIKETESTESSDLMLRNIQNKVSSLKVSGEKGDNSKSTAEDSESELDSDDDFVPFDTSNDVKISVKKRPKYLRDLIEGLADEKDIDVWIGSLEVCEELVYKQLPFDDFTLGLQILEILLCLEKKVFCENFEVLRFSGAVAIIVVHPEPSAEYLCKEFHQDVGKYSIASRMLILDMLSAAAKILSAPKSSSNANQTKSLVRIKSTEPDWHIVVKSRIDSHTRRICQPKKPPVVGTENKFAKVAGSFFFPLLRGSGKSTPGIVYRANTSSAAHSEDPSLLLVHFLRTCALILACAENSPAAFRMGKELLEATWSFRFHQEVRVRESVVACLAAVTVSVPPSRLTGELLSEAMEACMWLEDVVSFRGVVGKQNSEVDEQCRAFAAQVAYKLGSILSPCTDRLN